MMNRSTSIAYIDLLSVCFAFFVMLSALLMVQNADFHGEIPDKAEFIAIMEWPDHSYSDLDLWAQGPHGDLVFFKNKDAGFMTLDRDDRGMGENSVTLPDGSMVSDPHRREMISIRTTTEGTYTINVLLYGLYDKPPIPVHVQVIKLNPYQVIADVDLVLEHATQEETVVIFTIDASGRVLNIDKTTQKKLVQ